MTLSAKAKGKQRAVDPPLEEGKNPERSRELVIRFTEGIPDLTLRVDENDAVRDVKKSIRDARPQLEDRSVRLIHSGRLLTDGTLLYSWLTSLEERQRRATAEKDSGGHQAISGTTWLHCSVGPKIEAVGRDEGTIQTAQLKPSRGFDQLIAAGFSQSDIANFRSQFHSNSSPDYLDTEFNTEEEYDEHARALEEQWIDSLESPGTAPVSQPSSSNSSVIQGIVLGFFFPILPLFFMWKPHLAVFWDDGSEYESPDTVIFSQRMQMGIVVGLIVNVLFGMWKYLLDTS